METVDFKEHAKNRVRDHAGFTAFMFGDLREYYREGVEAVALIRVDPDSESSEHVRYGLSMLSRTASSLVNWQDPEARSRFVESRRIAALAPHGVG
jgi:hypothetical protein